MIHRSVSQERACGLGLAPQDGDGEGGGGAQHGRREGREGRGWLAGWPGRTIIGLGVPVRESGLEIEEECCGRRARP